MRNDHKTAELNARHVEYDIIEHFAAFCRQCVLLHGKDVKKTRIVIPKYLDQLPMTSYLVTIATDSRYTFVKMCVRKYGCMC